MNYMVLKIKKITFLFNFVQVYIFLFKSILYNKYVYISKYTLNLIIILIHSNKNVGQIGYLYYEIKNI